MSYTALEAATRLGVAEKTVRRWIDSGKLEAHKTASGHYAIAESEIERLLLERGDQDQPSDQDQAARIEALEQELAATRTRLEDLEQRLASLESRGVLV